MSKSPESRTSFLPLIEEIMISADLFKETFPRKPHLADISQLVEMGRAARKIQARADKMAAMIRDEMKRRQK